MSIVGGRELTQLMQFLLRHQWNVRLDVAVKKNWSFSIDQCVEHFRAFRWFEDNTSPPWSFHSVSGSPDWSDWPQFPWPFFGAFWLGEVLGLGTSSRSNHWAERRRFQRIHFLSHVTIRSRNGFVMYGDLLELSIVNFLGLFFARDLPYHGALISIYNEAIGIERNITFKSCIKRTLFF